MRRLIELKKILSITYKDNASGGPYQVTSDYKKFLNKRDFLIENIEFNHKFIFKYFLSKKKLKNILINLI